MGLDMYLLAQRKGKTVDGHLAVMNGMFPMAIKTDKEQIGYWRKAYDVCDSLFEELRADYEESNCVPLAVSKDILERMLSKSKERAANETDEWERQNWQDSVSIFTNALNILKAETDTQIFFEVWY